MKLTNNFNLSEFKCHDGTDVPEHLLPNVMELAKNLQVLRNHFGKPIHINSAYRTVDYNKKIGGATKSQHLIGKAADIRINGIAPKEVADAIEQLISEGKMKQGGLGRYNSFTHYDIRGVRSRWTL